MLLYMTRLYPKITLFITSSVHEDVTVDKSIYKYLGLRSALDCYAWSCEVAVGSFLLLNIEFQFPSMIGLYYENSKNSIKLKWGIGKFVELEMCSDRKQGDLLVGMIGNHANDLLKERPRLWRG